MPGTQEQYIREDVLNSAEAGVCGNLTGIRYTEWCGLLLFVTAVF